MSKLLLYPPIAFIIFLIIAGLLHKLSRRLGPKPTLGEEKLSPYACGEDIPGTKLQHSYNFFRFAFFFTILHIAVLVIATLPSGGIALLGLGYLVITFIAVTILLND
jgi:NADH-quinone oxidoreductase subunit A